MIEHERSYVFTHEGAERFLANKGIAQEVPVELIEDSYLGKGMRVRKSWIYQSLTDYEAGALPEEHTHVFTQKKGDKSKGYRFEYEHDIPEAMADAMTQDPKLQVRKVRRKLILNSSAAADRETYTVTMDFIEAPMKIAVMEVEALSEVVYPIPSDIAHRLWGAKLRECPLCSFEFFNRHIGICGGPSSGKSETAKILSHLINTDYGGNSFHVAEFATTFIQKYKKNPSFWEEFFIWHGQHEREHSADIANVVISDCPTFLTYIYLLHLPKEAFCPSTAMVLAKIYKRVLFDMDWYSDLIFLKLHEYKENKIRYQSAEEAQVIENRIKGFLDDHNISYVSADYTQVDYLLENMFYINHDW